MISNEKPEVINSTTARHEEIMIGLNTESYKVIKELIDKNIGNMVELGYDDNGAKLHIRFIRKNEINNQYR